MISTNASVNKSKMGSTGDRQKYFETFEATRAANEQLIRDLHKENEDLRKKFADLNAKAAAKGPNTDDDVEIHRETEKSNKLRLECDRIVAQSVEKEKLVKKLLDESIILEQQAQRPAAEDTPMGRKIRVLENRLDKAMIKYNEAQSIKKTYEQIVKRLLEEKMNSENQMANMDKTLKEKDDYIEELVSYSSNAMHEREYANQQLETAKYKYQQDHESREKQLKERALIKKQRDEGRRRNELREKMKQDYMNKKSEDLLASKHEVEQTPGGDSQQLRAELEKYESSFRKIKEATGVSDINEVLTKFISQDDTRRELESLSKENQMKIDTLTSERDSLKQKVDEMKYAIAGGRVGSRKIVDELEKSLNSAQIELERQKQKYERLTKTLIEAKAGIAHLGSKLCVDLEELKERKDDVVNILNLCEHKLLNMVQTIEESGQDVSNISEMQTDADNIESNRPFNRRVSINDEDTDVDGNEGGDNDTDIGTFTREQIKLASQNVIREGLNKAKRKARATEE